MNDLPRGARLYVVAVLTAGAVVLVLFGRSPIHNLVLFAALLLISAYVVASSGDT